ncbi:Hypothetical protein CAP_4402 [Chondromyces apiculatus DSM 436]|uniref:Uncharacterized protein n=1 Tax=Chondromyces apiculatus DSM 436 TaxID=1192034 RepID=A0A017T6G7_9BACT|nr:Hypothetical protein CAP_4402 [Chondromyces apiculatus DSM 436]
MREGDAFGFAGRARGVDDVGEVAGGRSVRGERCRLLRDLLPVGVQTHDGCVGPGQHVRDLRPGEHDPHLGVLDHEGQPLPRVGRVQRHVGAARLEDAEQPHHHVDGPLHADPHEHPGPHAEGAQVMRELAGARVECAVGELLVPAAHGSGLRRARGLLHEQRLDAFPGGVLRDGVVPFHQQAVPLGVGQQGQRGDGCVGILHDGAQQHAEVAGEPRDRLRVEQVRRVLEHAEETLGALLHCQGQIELRRPRGHFLGRDDEARQTKRVRRRVLQHEHHLEQGAVPEAPGDTELVGDLLEGDVLVRIGPERCLARARQERTEGGLAREICAQHQGVDEEAEEAFDLFPRAPGDGGADAEVRLVRVTAEEHREGRQQRHEQRRALLSAQRPQIVAEIAGELEGQGAAPVGDHGRPRTVRGKRKRGRARERRLPVGQVSVLGLSLQLAALPDGVVGVLDGQLGKRRGLPCREGLVEAPQLSHQHAHGPAVADDVVHGQEQRVLLVGGPQERRPKQRSLRQVEGRPRLLLAPPLHVRRGRVDGDQGPPRLLGDGLVRLPFEARERRPQRLVTLPQRAQASRERAHDEWAREAHDQGDVVERAVRLQPVEEPESFLGKRQRQRRAPRHRHERQVFLHRACPLRRLDLRGETCHGGCLEQHPQGKLHPEHRAQARAHLGRQQRVPTQLEEVVLHPHPIEPEQQRPDPGEDLLDRRARRDEREGVLKPPVGSRQGLAVHLAARGQRQGVEDDECRGDHVVGQLRAQMLAVGARRGAALHGHHVRHEALVSRDVLARHDHAGAHRGVQAEHRLDLAELDAEAADLHLVIDPAQVFQLPVLVPAGEVAGPVEPCALPAVQRALDEALRGERAPAQVAPRDPGAADVHLAGDADRHELPGRVEHVHLEVGDGTPDHARPRPRQVCLAQRAVRDVHGRLGDPVHVHEQGRLVAVTLPPGTKLSDVQGLAAEDHLPQRERSARLGRCRSVRAHQLAECRRGLVEDGHLLGAQERVEGLGISAHVVRNDHHPAAVKQRAPQLPDREVEGVGVEHRPHVARVEPEPRGRRREETDDLPVLDHRPLGRPRGARGVDDVGKIARLRLVRGWRRGLLRDLFPVGVQPYQPCVTPGQHLRHARLREHDGHLGVLDHEGQALPRVGGIQRQVRAAGFEDAQQPHHHLDRPLHAEPHQDVGAHAEGAQVVPELVGPRVQLPVRELLVPAAQRDGLRGPRGLLSEQLGKAPVRGVAGRRIVPLQQQAVPLRVGQQGQRGDRRPRVLHHRPQEHLQVRCEAGDGRGLEQIRRVFEDAEEALGALLHRQGQVELRRARRPLLGGDHEAWQARRVRRRVLQHEHHLEQRAVPEAPRNTEPLHQPLEGHILVRVGPEGRIPRARQERAEGGLARQIGAHDEGVEEAADETFGFFPGTARDGSTDAEVRLVRVPAEDHREGRQQRHEQRRALLAAQRAQAIGEVTRELEGQRAAAMRRHGRSGVVGRERERRSPRELAVPVGELLVEPCLGQDPPLPDGVIHVLDGQLGERRRLPRRECLVEGPQLAHEHAHRPAVADDVVHRREQHVLPLRHPQKRGPEERPSGEIERSPSLLVDQPGDVGRLHLLDEQGPRGLRGDGLVRLPIAGRERGPQRFVPPHQPAQAAREGVHVERPGEAHGRGDVVERAVRLQPIEEPQSFLSERQG